MLPEGWMPTTLGALGEIIGGTTPSRDVAHYWGGDIPWLTPSDITALKGATVVERGREGITESALNETALRLVPAGSVLMTSRATVGLAVVNTLPATTNQGFANFVPAPHVDAHFLAAWLRSSRARLESLASGSTFLEISKQTLRAVSINLPPLAEQRRIAEILQAADDAVATAEAVIDQTEKVKRGLVEELLTRGMPGRHSRFKMTEIGELPESWEVASLGSIARVEWGNTSMTKASYVAVGAVAYSASGPDGFVANAEFEGDGIVLSAIGARCGRIFRATGRWTAIKNTMTIIPTEATSVGYLAAALGNPAIWPSEGGAQPFIGLGKARQVQVRLPPVAEQQAIVARVDAAGAAVEEARSTCDMLYRARRGLSLELLSGERRVVR